MKNKPQDRETLLYVLYSYKIMIDRNKKEYPTVLISDLEKSINVVLEKNGYTLENYENHRSLKNER
jgi:hypothetical protein